MLEKEKSGRGSSALAVLLAELDDEFVEVCWGYAREFGSGRGDGRLREAGGCGEGFNFRRFGFHRLVPPYRRWSWDRGLGLGDDLSGFDGGCGGGGVGGGGFGRGFDGEGRWGCLFCGGWFGAGRAEIQGREPSSSRAMMRAASARVLTM